MLEKRFDGKQLWVTTRDGTKLDAFWIQTEGATSTVLFCNPNAVIYEEEVYDSSLIQFYRRLNMNVFLWNYRGYGRSKGTPSPSNICTDGEDVLKYLLAMPCIDETSQKVVVHG